MRKPCRRRSASQNAARFSGRLAKGIHQRRGADTEPNPKSVSRPYPPDSRVRGHVAQNRIERRVMRVHDAAILVHLQHAAQRLLQRARVEVIAVQAHQRHRPVEALRHAGRLLQGQPRSTCMSRAICCARRSDRPGTRACRISISCSSDGYGSQTNRHRRAARRTARACGCS